MNQLDEIELKILFAQNSIFDSSEIIELIQKIFQELNIKNNINDDFKGIKIFYVINNLLQFFREQISFEKSENFLKVLFSQDDTIYTEQEKNIFIYYLYLKNNHYSLSLDHEDELKEYIKNINQFLKENSNYSENNYISLAIYKIKIILLRLYNLLSFNSTEIINNAQILLNEIKKDKIKYNELLNYLNNFYYEDI